MFRLDDKIAVVFGGNGYLGHFFNKALLEYGAIVYSCDINEISVANRKLQDEFSERFFHRRINASSKEELLSLKEDILELYDRVDVLVNSTTSKGDDFYLPFEEVSKEGWEIGLEGNLTVPFLTCQVFIPVMSEQKSGSVINISSIYGLVGNDQRMYEGSNLHEIYVDKSPNIKQIYSHCVYNAAKGGLNMLTRYLAAYYGKDNVRINTITPGGIYYPNENETFLRKYSDKTPLARKCNPEEINGALIYLASGASSYVTGHNLVVDGGFTIW
jgi:NAD(P)-dependent dehydrogenase (short-subunit alcohol dehydrogenase family)